MAQSASPCSRGSSLGLWRCWRRVRLWGEVGLGILEEERCREAETLGNSKSECLKESLYHAATHLSSWPVEPRIWAVFQGINAFEWLPSEAVHLSGCSMELHVWQAPCRSHASAGLTHSILLLQVWHALFVFLKETKLEHTKEIRAKQRPSSAAGLLC